MTLSLWHQVPQYEFPLGWCNFHWFVDKGSLPDNHKPCCSTSHRTQSHRGKYISKDHRDVILHCCVRIIQDAKKAHVPSFTPVSTEQCGWWTAPVPSTGIYLGTRDQRTRMCNGCATDSICSVARYVPATFSTTQTTFRSVTIPGTPRVIETYNYEFLKEDLMVNK